MEERGVFVDHSSINRWAIRFLPSLDKAFREHKHPVGGSWRMDETYIKIRWALRLVNPQYFYQPSQRVRKRFRVVL